VGFADWLLLRHAGDSCTARAGRDAGVSKV
jgi:hypothetical protein